MQEYYSNTTNDKYTYGYIILPYTPTVNKPKTNQKDKTNLMGKLTSAKDKAVGALTNAVTHPTQTFKNMATYLYDHRSEMMNYVTNLQLTSKFSGIAVAQTLVSGKVTSKEALDYLFMGFTPALGVTASAMGYSGITQMKDALTNGSIDVGGLVNGFTKAQKSIVDLKDQFSNKVSQKNGRVIEFDLTISHNESYQSETPDRRVENGNTVTETVHNLPITFDVTCAFQEDKRYSHGDLRAIFTELRDRKVPIKLQLGTDLFNDLILTNFSPTNDCTKSGMDYNLSFKQIIIGTIDLTTKVEIQQTPVKVEEKPQVGGLSSVGKGAGKRGTGVRVVVPPIPNIKTPADGLNIGKTISSWKKSFLKKIFHKDK